MHARLKDPDNQDLRMAKLTWAGKHYTRGIKKGIKQGVEQGIKQGVEQGIEQGTLMTLRQSVQDLCTLLQVRITKVRGQRLQTMTLPELQALRQHLLAHKTWPRLL